MKKQCSNCYFNDMCACNGACDDYVAIIEDDQDAYIWELIESGRREFYKEWDKYLYGNKIF